jgi:hypothetical protein
LHGFFGEILKIKNSKFNHVKNLKKEKGIFRVLSSLFSSATSVGTSIAAVIAATAVNDDFVHRL